MADPAIPSSLLPLARWIDSHAELGDPKPDFITGQEILRTEALDPQTLPAGYTAGDLRRLATLVRAGDGLALPPIAATAAPQRQPAPAGLRRLAELASEIDAGRPFDLEAFRIELEALNPSDLDISNLDGPSEPLSQPAFITTSPVTRRSYAFGPQILYADTSADYLAGPRLIGVELAAGARIELLMWNYAGSPAPGHVQTILITNHWGTSFRLRADRLSMTLQSTHGDFDFQHDGVLINGDYSGDHFFGTKRQPSRVFQPGTLPRIPPGNLTAYLNGKSDLILVLPGRSLPLYTPWVFDRETLSPPNAEQILNTLTAVATPKELEQYAARIRGYGLHLGTPGARRGARGVPGPLLMRR